MVDVAWKNVTCRECKRTYECTPEDDYYNAKTLTDGICFTCLCESAGLDPEKSVTVRLCGACNGQEVGCVVCDGTGVDE